MGQYAGLDVSLNETTICVMDAGEGVMWRGRCRSTSEAMAATLARHAPEAARGVLAGGTLSPWYWHGLGH